MSDDLSKRLEAWARDMQTGRSSFGADQDLKEAAAALRAFAERERQLIELIEEAYAEGFQEGYDGGWNTGYDYPWKRSGSLDDLKKLTKSKDR